MAFLENIKEIKFQFIAWNDLTHPQNKFIKNGSFIIEADITIKTLDQMNGF